jgi:hypothetical protein
MAGIQALTDVTHNRSYMRSESAVRVDPSGSVKSFWQLQHDSMTEDSPSDHPVFRRSPSPRWIQATMTIGAPRGTPDIWARSS